MSSHRTTVDCETARTTEHQPRHNKAVESQATVPLATNDSSRVARPSESRAASVSWRREPKGFWHFRTLVTLAAAGCAPAGRRARRPRASAPAAAGSRPWHRRRPSATRRAPRAAARWRSRSLGAAAARRCRLPTRRAPHLPARIATLKANSIEARAPKRRRRRSQSRRSSACDVRRSITCASRLCTADLCLATSASAPS